MDFAVAYWRTYLLWNKLIRLMLKLGGYINIGIAIGHIVGLFWADKMFEVTGVSSPKIRYIQKYKIFLFQFL
jgi:hypothetical protein